MISNVLFVTNLELLLVLPFLDKFSFVFIGSFRFVFDSVPFSFINASKSNTTLSSTFCGWINLSMSRKIIVLGGKPVRGQKDLGLGARFWVCLGCDGCCTISIPLKGIFLLSEQFLFAGWKVAVYFWTCLFDDRQNTVKILSSRRVTTCHTWLVTKPLLTRAVSRWLRGTENETLMFFFFEIRLNWIRKVFEELLVKLSRYLDPPFCTGLLENESGPEYKLQKLDKGLSGSSEAVGIMIGLPRVGSLYMQSSCSSCKQQTTASYHHGSRWIIHHDISQFLWVREFLTFCLRLNKR